MSSPSPSLASLCPWVDQFAQRKLLVWGDLVADRFLLGSTTRVSREAPALVLRYEDEEVRPGGAGNAALNAAELGAAVAVFGFLGDDSEGARLLAQLEGAGIDTTSLVTRTDGCTPVKTRVMAGGFHTVRQQILRIDNDRPWARDDATAADLLEKLARAAADADGLLISDYGLGTVTPELYRRLRERLGATVPPLTLDSRHRILEFPGVTAATPNENEVESALRISLNGDRCAIERAGTELLERLRAGHLLITRGSFGMAVFEAGATPLHLEIHGTDEIADVTGAGDTVIATLTLALAAGAGIAEAACLANVAAGLAVLKHGTATVPREELLGALRQDEG